jgi:hypothetical protein
MKFKSLAMVAAADPETAGDLLLSLPSAKRLRYAKRLGDPNIFAMACAGHHPDTIIREAAAYGIPPLDLILAIAVEHPQKAIAVARAMGIAEPIIKSIRSGGSLHLSGGWGEPLRTDAAGPLDDLFSGSVPRTPVPALPEGLKIPGDLLIEKWDGAKLPRLSVGGEFVCRESHSLRELPDIQVSRKATIENCRGLTTLGSIDALTPGAEIEVSSCPSLATISAIKAPLSKLTLVSLPRLQRLPSGVVDDLQIDGCHRLTSVDGVSVRKSVLLFDLPTLSSTPPHWSGLASLDVSRCPGLLKP